MVLYICLYICLHIYMLISSEEKKKNFAWKDYYHHITENPRNAKHWKIIIQMYKGNTLRSGLIWLWELIIKSNKIQLAVNWKSNCVFQFSSVAQSCPTLCNPMNCSMPGLPVHHQLPEFTQTHIHWVGDAIQPSHPLSSPSPPAPNPSQHQSLFQWVNSLHEVAKVLEFQL